MHMRRRSAAATTASGLPPFLAFLAWAAVTSRRPSSRATACISCIRALSELLAPVGSCAGHQEKCGHRKDIQKRREEKRGDTTLAIKPSSTNQHTQTTTAINSSYGADTLTGEGCPPEEGGYASAPSSHPASCIQCSTVCRQAEQTPSRTAHSKHPSSPFLPHPPPSGAYNPDAYYQELDQGFGDVGVDQVSVPVRALWARGGGGTGSLTPTNTWCVCMVVSAVGGSSPALAFLSCRH